MVALLNFVYDLFFVFWALVLFSHSAFLLGIIFKSNQNKLKMMIIMLNITIINTYPLKQLISKKLKLLKMNKANNLKFAHEI